MGHTCKKWPIDSKNWWTHSQLCRKQFGNVADQRPSGFIGTEHNEVKVETSTQQQAFTQQADTHHSLHHTWRCCCCTAAETNRTQHTISNNGCVHNKQSNQSDLLKFIHNQIQICSDASEKNLIFISHAHEAIIGTDALWDMLVRTTVCCGIHERSRECNPQ